MNIQCTCTLLQIIRGTQCVYIHVHVQLSNTVTDSCSNHPLTSLKSAFVSKMLEAGILSHPPGGTSGLASHDTRSASMLAEMLLSVMFSVTL